MTDDEWRAFVSEGTRTGKLAIVRKNGFPHVVPVWFVVDGDDIVFNTGEATVKGRAIARDGRVSMCVDEEDPPYSYVQLNGRATVSDDLEELRKFATLIGARYMGADRAEEFGARNGVPGELLVRFTPDHVVAERDVAD
ncbi:MAG: PPOX class F420-dependent oxidoreductase [Actinomycetota bacterium]